MKVRGEWCYLYRAVDKDGQTLDFMLSEQRDETAALKFLAKAITANGLPRACAIDKSGANTAGLRSMNAALKDVGSPRRIRVYGSVAKFRISVALPGASSQTAHFPETQPGLKS